MKLIHLFGHEIENTKVICRLFINPIKVLPKFFYPKKSRKKFITCGSTKYPYPHHRRSLEIPRGGGFLKAKIFQEKYEP